jgi:hypothetical protein
MATIQLYLPTTKMSGPALPEPKINFSDDIKASRHPKLSALIAKNLIIQVHGQNLAVADALIGSGATCSVLFDGFKVSNNDRGVPGRGHIDFLVTFRAIKSDGYDG